MATQPLFPTDQAWDDFITNELSIGNNSLNGTEWRLAKLISSPEFNDDQRREIVTRLLTDDQMPGLAAFVLADDPGSAAPALMEPGQSLGQGSRGQQVIEDQTVIAGVVNAAFRSGEIKVEHLTALAANFEAGDERVASLLGRDHGGPGGAGEAYALALLDKYPPETAHDDPAAALDAQGMAYSMLANDPALREKHFDGDPPAKDPRVAFETLVAYNDSHPYNPHDSVLRSGQAADGLTAATTLYQHHTDLLLDQYSSQDGKAPENPEMLANFWSQASISADARGLEIPVPPPGQGMHPLHTAISDATQDYTAAIIQGTEESKGLATLEDTPEGILAQRYALQTLGSLQAAARVATDISLTRYQDELAAGAATQGEFGNYGAAILGELGGKIPVVGPLADDAGRALGEGVGALVSGEKPAAPDVSSGHVQGLENDIVDAQSARPGNGLGVSEDMPRTYRHWADEYAEDIVDAITIRDLKPLDRVYSSPQSTGEQQSSLAMPGAGTVDVASLSSTGHPDFARYAASLQGCEACKLPLDQTELANVASTVALRSREAGLPSVDHIVATTSGDRVFAVAGKLDDPAHLRISVPVDEARGRSVETNSREWAELQRTTTAEMTQDTELAQRHAPRMA